jgi:hypothetical protein
LNKTVSPLLYISTDEKDKTFFAPFAKNFEVRFFAVGEPESLLTLILTRGQDVVEKAGLVKGKFDQNHVGMVEQV